MTRGAVARLILGWIKMSEPIRTLELRVPRTRRDVVGTVIGAILAMAFPLFFAWLAIYDLLNSIAFIPSILWLALVGFIIFVLWKEMGPKKVLIEIAGAFAPKQFVWVNPRGDTRKEMHYGYQVFGHRISYWKIPADKITEVYWNTGQASHMAGRDMNDWHVVIWYEHGDPAKMLKREKYSKNPDQDLYLVGPSGKKENTAAFGRSLLDLLQKSGVLLSQGEDDCHFKRDVVAKENV